MAAEKTDTAAILRPTRTKTPAEPRQPGLEGQLRKFDRGVRARVRAMVRKSDRVADLVRVFPGIVHQLAEPALPQAEREAALSAIEQGRPLKQVSRLLGLPLWMRKLPPDAFDGEIPRLPDDDDFLRRIATRLPRQKRQAKTWLEAVAFANKAAGPEFALWVAERPEIVPSDMTAEQALRVLAAYAAVCNEGSSPAQRLAAIRWRPEMATDSALCGAMTWLNRARLVTFLRDRKLAPWLSPGKANGYTFEPLLTVDDFLLEAQLMHNCVDQYAVQVCTDRCRLFSVRHDGARVATVEVARHPKEPTVFTITQLKGPSNIPAPLPVWQAAYGWLSKQERLTSVPSLYNALPRGQARVWSDLFRGYRRNRQGAPWWPATPTSNALSQLDMEVKRVAQNAHVVSWLFR